MTAPKPKYMPDPRGLTQEQLAARLGVSAGWLCANRDVLIAAGLPQPDAITNRTDAKALEKWMDIRAGIATEGDIGFDLARDRVRQLHGQRRA